MMEVNGKRVLVMGLARTGLAAARMLRKRNARVTVTDSRPPSAFQAEIPELLALQVGLELGQHREETFLNQDLIVVSPGIPWDMKYLAAARQHQITVVPEIELASWFLEGTLVGITGSNGKTTTTSLLGKMLVSSDMSTFVGGNIGVPLISAVDRTGSDSVLAVELSSFQLEAIQSFRPRVAVLLNLSPNHLDRHHTFEAYTSAKARLFQNQGENDYAILNADDRHVMAIAPTLRSRKIYFSRQWNLPDGVFVSGHQVLYRTGNLERVLLETSDVRLRGAFNVENVLAAAAAACVVGADFDALRRAVREFNGVEHRLEFVREIRRVEFYNDSKATSVDATAKALSAFEGGVHLILGGKDKGAPYTPLRPLLKGRARQALLIGASADKIAHDLEGAVEMVRASDLESAVRHAFSKARAGDVVLLAPACASYDQFRDFEERGQRFKEIVERLAHESAIQAANAQVEIVTPGPPRSAGIPVKPPEKTAEIAKRSLPEDFQIATPPGQPATQIPTHDTTGNEKAELVSEIPPPGQHESTSEADNGSGAELVASSPAPAPLRQFPPSEFVYVYEVSAEEFSPMKDLRANSSASIPLHEAGEIMTVPESIPGELMPYEVSRRGKSRRSKPENEPSLFGEPIITEPTRGA